MRINEDITSYFNGRIRQVFIYVTNRCQLRCRQCLYKPLLDNSTDDLPFHSMVELLRIFKQYGAFKASFLGGEPTLYRDTIARKDFGDIILTTKQLGYQIVRADTNGQFNQDLLENSNVRQLDEITFSLDGHNSTMHDSIRGKVGAFDICTSRIKQAVALGYRVQITSCVHREMCQTSEHGIANILKMIDLCIELGVHILNFHPILQVGVPRDNWIDQTEIDPYTWLEVYEFFEKYNEYKIQGLQLRMPKRFEKATSSDLAYNYCPVRMGERALIMPNRQIKVCAFNIGTPYCIANFDNESITVEKNFNEWEQSKSAQGICATQTAPSNLNVLCMSYKPNQNEAVWNTLGGG